MNLLPIARQYLAAGLCVVPISASGEKRPDLKEWKNLEQRRPSSEEIENWFSRPKPMGIGIITGKTSGNLEVLDFDESILFGRFLELAEKNGLLDLVRSLPLEESPRPGQHLFYCCSEIAGNLKLARRKIGVDEKGHPKVKTLIESRGEGGFIVVSPTPAECHELKKPYILLSGSLTAIPTIAPEQRKNLLALARSFNEYIEINKLITGDAKKSSKENEGTRPGDDFNSRSTWPEILEPHGWKAVYSRGETTCWRRPDKSRGISATTNHAGSNLLYVFSSSTIFESERGYSHFSAYAMLNHKGDFKAAAKDLANKGFGIRTSGNGNGAIPIGTSLPSEAPPTENALIDSSTEIFPSPAPDSSAIPAITTRRPAIDWLKDWLLGSGPDSPRLIWRQKRDTYSKTGERLVNIDQIKKRYSPEIFTAMLSGIAELSRIDHKEEDPNERSIQARKIWTFWIEAAFQRVMDILPLRQDSETPEIAEEKRLFEFELAKMLSRDIRVSDSTDEIPIHSSILRYALKKAGKLWIEVGDYPAFVKNDGNPQIFLNIEAFRRWPSPAWDASLPKSIHAKFIERKLGIGAVIKVSGKTVRGILIPFESLAFLFDLDLKETDTYPIQGLEGDEVVS